ncbi:ATP-binding cassette domain-containing protein [Eggerthella sinensis]|uniref:ATP-binding cassette domain-containing protein n=1 Tax=Eggerthella sinensis TaxID=242230 RepID=UPI0022E3370A|nr:ATP-binding cassette domain-containing protein [Eggerthella sinensis]
MAGVMALETSGFSFSYPDASAGIGPLDWRVEEGVFQLMVGATGSGKTTLLRCCTPAIAPAGERAGSIRVFGRPVDELDAGEAASTVGYVAQSPENQIVCDTVWHELASGWRTSAWRRTRCAAAWPRWRTSSASSRGFAAPSTSCRAARSRWSPWPAR